MSTKLIGTWQGWIQITITLAVAVLIAFGVNKVSVHYGGQIPAYLIIILNLLGVLMLGIAVWISALERRKREARLKQLKHQ